MRTRQVVMRYRRSASQAAEFTVDIPRRARHAVQPVYTKSRSVIRSEPNSVHALG
jgi:hypothetical protein